MHAVAQEIKSKIDIVDFLSKFITLQKAGRNYKALCPFHQEKSPSFMVSSDRQNWRCFGSCQEGGDVISFLMKWENFTFYEALQSLAEVTGVSLSQYDVQDESYKIKSRFASINSSAKQAFAYYLQHESIGKDARDYLEARQITDKIIATFSLGFAPPTKKALVTYLLKNGFSPKELVEAGVALKTYSGEIIDRFHDRLMFPIYDPRGIIVGFSGRTLVPNPKEAKYINSPETFLYKKRETLYGIHLTKKKIEEKDCAILVEGEFDMISCFINGITNVVAIKGSALTEEQLVLLSRYTKTITLALDGDASGLTTTKRVLPITEKFGFKVQIAQIEGGKDPDEALKNNAIDFKKAISKPIPVYDFIIDFESKKNAVSDPYGKADFIKEIAPYIMTIDNPIVKSHYLKKVSSLIGVDTETIEKTFIQSRDKKSHSTTSVVKKFDKIDEEEQYALSLLLQSPDIFNAIDTFKINDVDEIFTNVAIGKIVSLLVQYKNINKTFDAKVFTTTLPSELIDMFDKAYLRDISNVKSDELEKKLKNAILQLRRKIIKPKINQLIKSKSLDDNAMSEIAKLTLELSDIEKNLSLL